MFNYITILFCKNYAIYIQYIKDNREVFISNYFSHLRNFRNEKDCVQYRSVKTKRSTHYVGILLFKNVQNGR